MQRSGLGRINEREFQERFRKVFKDYIASDSDSDLVFAPDFSSAERKVLHQFDGLTGGKDLFDIDYDKESSSEDDKDTLKQTIDDEDSLDNIQCIVCHNLSVCTGEESDGDVYDFMWGSTVDSTGLVPAKRFTDVEVCDLSNISSEESQPIQAEEFYCSKKVSDILYGQDLSCLSSKSSLGIENSGIYFVLPDGSVLNMSIDHIKSNQVLNKLTFQSGWKLIPGMKIYIAENDMDSIPGLKESLLNSPNSKLIVDNTNVTDMDLSDLSSENSKDNPTNNPEGFYSSKQIEVSNVLYGQDLLSESSQLILGNKNNGIIYVLPDGSVWHISVDYVKSNQALKKLTFLTGQKLIPGIKINVTQNDMNFIPGLKENLLNSVNSTLSFDQMNFECSLSKKSSWEKKANIFHGEKSLVTTNGERNLLQKLTIFLPDGSYKRLSLKKIQKNGELAKFTSYLPGKNANELENQVTMNDLRLNKAIRELFSDFFVTRKPLEKQQETLNHNPKMSDSQETTTSVTANSFNEDDSQSMDWEYTEELGDIKDGKDAGKIDDNVRSDNIETLPSVIQSYNNERRQRGMGNANITPHINNQIIGNEPNKNIDDRLTWETERGIDDGQLYLPKSRCSKIRFFLPDGSVKRLRVQTILDNKALVEQLRKGRYISDEDLNTNQALRQYFCEYISSPKKQNSCKQNPGFPKFNTFTSSNQVIQSKPGSESSQKYNDPLNFTQKDVHKVKYQEYPHNFNTGTSSNLQILSKPVGKNPKIRVFLPDGSFRRLSIPTILKHKALHEHLQQSRYITDEDFKTNQALREYFLDYIGSPNKVNPSKQSPGFSNYITGTSSKHMMHEPTIEGSGKFNNPLNSAQDIYQTKSQEHPKMLNASLNPKQTDFNHVKCQERPRMLNAPLNPKPKDINQVKCQELPTSKLKEHSWTKVALNCDKMKTSNQCFNLNMYHKDSLSGDSVNMVFSTNHKSSRKRPAHRRKKIYLPDGSFKRVFCSVIENNKDLQHLRFQSKITIEDLKQNKALRELFSDYVKSSGILNGVDESNLNMISGDPVNVQMHNSNLSTPKEKRKLINYKDIEDNASVDGKPMEHKTKGKDTPNTNKLAAKYFITEQPTSSAKETGTTIADSVNIQASDEVPENSCDDTESLQIVWEEQGVDSLEDHINSSTITTIHSSESV